MATPPKCLSAAQTQTATIDGAQITPSPPAGKKCDVLYIVIAKEVLGAEVVCQVRYFLCVTREGWKMETLSAHYETF